MGPADQPVSFAELFFDLVFVFTITQVVHLFHGEFDWVHIGRAVLVFWLVWWAWTQFTWALNAADTSHRWIQVGTIGATLCAFFMAVSVPQSFSPVAWWFSSSYVAVRVIGLLIYLWVAWSDSQMRQAVKIFGGFSILGLLSALVGGFIGGEAQYWFWGITIILDIHAANVGGNNESWNLHPKHFAERHGLFVIIALGESLIIAASGVAEESWNVEVIYASMLAIGISACFWWLYFSKAKDAMEHAFAHHSGSKQSRMGRDAYSLFHFPLVCGLITLAFAIEESLKHPTEIMTYHAQAALSISILLYSISLTFSLWRTTGQISWMRIVGTVCISLVCYFLPGLQTLWVLLIAFSGLFLLCVVVEFAEANEITLEKD